MCVGRYLSLKTGRKMEEKWSNTLLNSVTTSMLRKSLSVHYVHFSLFICSGKMHKNSLADAGDKNGKLVRKKEK